LNRWTHLDRAWATLPSAAVYLVVAAVVSDVFPATRLSVVNVERIGTAALVVILFDGGASIGVRRFREASWPIASLGVLGTFATAGLLALFAHWALGFAWITSGLLAAAIAPTDPAVVFSLLGERGVGGRVGTILEGESGANDPVGIALMLGLLELATHPEKSFWVVVRIFVEQMGIGLATGVLGGLVGRRLLRQVRLHTVGLLALAACVYTVAAVADGSGFLAVFVAGVLVGDLSSPPHAERAATVAEIAVFVALGLTIDLGGLTGTHVAEGLALAGCAAILARPAALAPLLAATRLRSREAVFVMWAGLKGAVPILLAAFALGKHVAHARQIYDIVFVVVLVSVIVQGGSIAYAARRLGIEERATRRASRAGSAR
jgi:cell volume regulation protein A